MPYDLESFGLVLLAGLLGGLIGIERELADKPAGLRTHIFIASGAALLVIIAEGAFEVFQHDNPDTQVISDPVRVIQAIVIGIGFLGAGTIVHERHRGVSGLTTAASIFLTAGIGIAVAVRRIPLAVEVTLYALLVLWGVGWLERWLLPDENAPSSPSDADAPPP